LEEWASEKNHQRSKCKGETIGRGEEYGKESGKNKHIERRNNRPQRNKKKINKLIMSSSWGGEGVEKIVLVHKNKGGKGLIIDSDVKQTERLNANELKRALGINIEK